MWRGGRETRDEHGRGVKEHADTWIPRGSFNRKGGLQIRFRCETQEVRSGENGEKGAEREKLSVLTGNARVPGRSVLAHSRACVRNPGGFWEL